jgi:branched-chain amino acid transport system substrate-binding protein
MKHRSWLIRIALTSVVALVAAACAEGDGDGAAAECPDTELGCVEVAADAPVRIGTLLVISGSDASLGLDSQHGVEIAADMRDNTVAGHPIELVHQDDGCSAEGGQAGAQALSAEEGIAAVIGTSCSSSALGVADRILGDAGITLLSPSNTSPALTDAAQRNEFYFRTAHNDKIQGAVVANFAVDEAGAKTAATIHDGSPYAEGLQQAFADVFESLGGTITVQEAVQVGDADFKPLLQDIAADDPDFLYYPIFVAEGGLITSQAREIPALEGTALAGSDGMFTPDWIEAAGAENAEGVYISGPDLTKLGNKDFYDNTFIPAYEEKFGDPTSVFHAHSFDAMNMILDAIEAVAIETEDGGLLIPRTQLRDAVAQTSGFEGITGTLSCNETGDCQPSATIAIHQVASGDFGDPIYSKAFTLEELGA